MIIFLDFDGVLHPLPSSQHGVFCHLDRFESLVRKLPAAQIVISSSWRETYPWDVIREFFSEDVREKVIGMTPVLECGNRYEEIQAWLKENDCEGRWIALDDARDDFPRDCSQLFLCETVRGFDENAAARFQGWIESNLFKSLPSNHLMSG